MQTIYKGIAHGTEIVDKNGHKVGTVHEVIANAADQLQMITVQKGLLFKTDIGIPVASIDRMEGGKIHLNVEKGDLVELLRPDPAAGSPAEPVVAGAATVPAGVVEREAAAETPPGAVGPVPNAAGPRPDVIHDQDTGAQTFDRGIGSAGVPGMDAGGSPLTTGGLGSLAPTQAEEPTSRDRT